MNNNPLPLHCRDLLPKAKFKQRFEDFQVDELLGFEPDGEGEHLWLQVKKTGRNTRDIIDSLIESFGVAEKDTGFSGLKDKHAVTTQWISIPFRFNQPCPDINLLPSVDGIEYLKVTKSLKKLRRGSHRFNAFNITLREIETDHDAVEQCLSDISKTGFPNYFGSQRFGRQGSNVDQARSMFNRRRKLSRFKRSLFLSAARSYLFNQVLASRVQACNWLQVLPGEVCMLDGSNSVFNCAQPDAAIQRRHDETDIHTTGPMHGRGTTMVTDHVKTLESECLQAEENLCSGLESAGLKAERRALRAVAHDLHWNWLDTSTIKLSFSLQRGVYATSLLREVFDLQQREFSS